MLAVGTCSIVVRHVPEGEFSPVVQRRALCTTLEILDFTSEHIVVSSFVCALSDLLLIRVTASMAQVKQ